MFLLTNARFHAALLLLAAGLLLTGCNSMNNSGATRTFAQDVAFLRKHTDVIVLGRDGGPQVAVAPRWQGRVMTSTVGGDGAVGCGWINDEHIASGKLVPHMNVFGGEDRFWLGPEGGQYAIYFKKGDPFDFDHWQTPACIDTDPYRVASQSNDAASFEHSTTVENYSGTRFDLGIHRTVRLLDAGTAGRTLGVSVPPSVKTVAYESENTICNTGSAAWKSETGLLSIWILSMYKPAPNVTVAIPYQPGPERERGPIVNDAYFGKVPANRLKITPDAIFFRCDGTQRGKLGLSPKRAKPVAGSYDADSKMLTIVQLTIPPAAMDYVNSMWEVQKNPYGGDVVNSYNDGPPGPGKKPLGPFYEIESSSPAAALAPGDTLTHVHRTFHFQGDEAALDPIARHVLGVGVGEIRDAFRS